MLGHLSLPSTLSALVPPLYSCPAFWSCPSCMLRPCLTLLSCAAPPHKTELIVVCEIEVAVSSEPKHTDRNSERSDALPAIGTIILASRVFHKQERSILIWVNMTHQGQNHLAILTPNIAPMTLSLHPIHDIYAENNCDKFKGKAWEGTVSIWTKQHSDQISHTYISIN